MKKLIALLMVVVMVVCCSGCSIVELIFGGEDAMYIEAAKELVEKEFPSVSSVRFNDEEIYDEDDYGRAIVYLDVTFGASLQRDVYVCIKSVSEEGYTYHPYYSYTLEKSEISELKEYNDWGEPQ